MNLVPALRALNVPELATLTVEEWRVLSASCAWARSGSGVAAIRARLLGVHMAGEPAYAVGGARLHALLGTARGRTVHALVTDEYAARKTEFRAALPVRTH